MPQAITFLLLFAAFFSVAHAEPVVFLVRHAEKVEAAGADPKDPDLSVAGRERADRLALMLRDAGIRTVYATEFKRTQQTAEPLARAASLSATIVPAGDTAGLLARLRAGTGNALVIGHSNTIPEIIKLLGVQLPVLLAESDYDNVFVVLRDPEPRLLRLHF